MNESFCFFFQKEALCLTQTPPGQRAVGWALDQRNSGSLAPL
jgi:hypothetical protein